MDQVASSFYSALLTLLLSQASCPQQRWQKWIQPHQAFHSDKRAARGRGGCLFSICLGAPQSTFLHIQLVKLSQVSILKLTSDKVDWATLISFDKWVLPLSPAPELGLKPVSPETHGHAEKLNTLKCGRRGMNLGRQICSECLVQFALI